MSAGGATSQANAAGEGRAGPGQAAKAFHLGHIEEDESCERLLGSRSCAMSSEAQ
jgi:hypothetical protein